MNYFKVYCDLINKRIDTPAFTTEKLIGEKHHIIPRSCENKQIILDLFKDYNVGQLVNLIYREHYIAHMLLVKIMEKTNDIVVYEPLPPKVGSFLLHRC